MAIHTLVTALLVRRMDGAESAQASLLAVGVRLFSTTFFVWLSIRFLPSEVKSVWSDTTSLVVSL
eukprot:182259-Pelagomonas_calceolata.AAC.4